MLGTPGGCTDGSVAFGSSQASVCMCVWGVVDRCTNNHKTDVAGGKTPTAWEIRDRSYFQLGNNVMEDFMEEGASEPDMLNLQV